MIYYDARIRAILEQVILPTLKRIAKQSGVQPAYRIVTTYADECVFPSIATLTYHTGCLVAKLKTLHDIHIIPHQHKLLYCKVINAIDGDLPDAMREINK